MLMARNTTIIPTATFTTLLLNMPLQFGVVVFSTDQLSN
jgi:hypothetical protein